MKTSQVDRLYNLLSDGRPHSTVEILEEVYGGDHLGLARVAARIYDVKKKYHVNIKCWSDSERRTMSWYQIDTALGAQARRIVEESNRMKAERSMQMQVPQMQLL